MHLKKLTVLAASALFAAASTMSVFAATPATTSSVIDYTKTGSMTLYKVEENNGNIVDGTNLDSQLDDYTGISGVEFSYIKIADVDQVTDSTDTSATYYGNLSSDFTNLLKKYNIALSGTAINGKTYYQASDINTAMKALQQNTKGGQVAVNSFVDASGTEMVSTDADGKTTVSDLPLGLYLVAETDTTGADETDSKIVAPSVPFLVSLPSTNIAAIGDQAAGTVWQYDAYVYPKNQTISINKKLVADDGETLITTDDKNIGDTISQVITINTPELADGNSYDKYVVSDVMSDGLTIDKDSVRVYVDGSETTGFTYAYDSATNKWSAALTETGLQALNTGVSDGSVDVTVKFDAVLNGKAVVGSGNNNTATLNYKTTATTEDSITSNTPSIYTYEIDLTKTFKSLATADFSKVKFKVANTTGDISFILEEDGTYHKYDGQETGTKVTEISPNSTSGILKIQGLDEGTYTLTETSTVSGQNLLSDKLTVVIKGYDPVTGQVAEASVQSGSDDSMAITSEDMKNGVVPISVVNDAVIDVLHTGGSGINPAVFVIGGAVMACGISVAVIAKKKKKA